MPAVRQQRAKRWSFTSFKVDEFWEYNWNDNVYGDDAQRAFKYLIIGKEICPRTNREHIQGYVEFSSVKSMRQVQVAIGDSAAHCEISKGTTEQNREYCKKQGNWKEFGHPMPGQGCRSDLEDCKKMLADGADMFDVMEKHPSDFLRYHNGLAKMKDLYDRRRQKESVPSAPEVIVFIGRAGSGKTHHAYELAGGDYYQYLCQQSGKVYFDGYHGQKTIWFDEFSGSTMPFHLWCRLADKWGCRVETKGSSVEVIGLERIIISSIEYPADWWSNSARFLKDPKQLWRRITKIYFVPGGAGYDQFFKPMIIERDDWPRICDSYLDNLQTMAVAYDS